MAKKLNNELHWRVTNTELLAKIDEAMASNVYSSRNELINACVKNSIDDILLGIRGKHEKLYREHENMCGALSAEIHRRGKKWDSNLRELGFNDFVLEKMLCSIYHLLVYEKKGKKLALEDIERGLFGELPMWLEEMLNEMKT